MSPFLVRVSDHSGGFHFHLLFSSHRDYALVTVVVAPTNRAPVAGNDSYSGVEDAVVQGNVLTNDSDPDDDALSAALVDGPSHGTVVLNADGSFTYAPNADFHGADSFTYRATDGVDDSEVATVTVTITPINDTPVATNDTVTVDEDGLLNVKPTDLLANDTDTDRDHLTIDGYTQPEHGDLWINRDGSISYNPDDDYHGTDTFTYTVTDGTETTTATVTVQVPIAPLPSVL